MACIEDKAGMNLFPFEVLEEILMQTENVQDLLICRLVNKTWQKVASSALRRLYIRISSEVFNETLMFDKFCATFIGTAEQGLLPWSAISIPASAQKFSEITSYAPVVELLLYQFLDNFGQFVRKVRFSGTSYEAAIEVLGKLNHLENMVCNFGATRSDKAKLGHEEIEHQEAIEEPVEGSMDLAKLKTLRVDINFRSSFLYFQHVVGNTSRKLKYVYIKFDSYHRGIDEIVNKVARSLTQIESVSLSFRNESTRYTNAFSGIGLKIREASIYFSRYPPRPVDWEALETFLSSSGPYLEKLSFECYRNIPTPEFRKLQFPVLPKLRILKLVHCVSPGYFTSQAEASIPSSFRFFYPLTAIELPYLEEVDIEYTGSCTLFGDSQFKSVRSLRVIHSTVDSPMKTFWHNAFPNLKSLKTRVNQTSLLSIFLNLTDLESLSLDLSPCAEDVNLLLTGLRDSFLETQDEVDEYRRIHNVSSLMSMKGLRKLFLHFGDFNQIGELGIKFALLQIQPLETLGLGGVTISPSLAYELSSYHNRFEKLLPWTL